MKDSPSTSSGQTDHGPAGFTPGLDVLARFAADLDRLSARGERIGVAVSGGPDSLALLLLASAARPGQVEAATVDHALRPESRLEAARVAALCGRLGVPHATLKVEWRQPPTTAIQERARDKRYRLLGKWVGEHSLAALLTAHHADDQAETLLMRLNRGAGARGLAGMRPLGRIPGAGGGKLLRPLLSWRRAELEAICAAAAIEPVRDPSNEDERFERVRVRDAIASADWLDPQALARSAANLGDADEALDWVVDAEWERAVAKAGAALVYTPAAPLEIRRRIVGRAIATLASEGVEEPLRGPELDRLLAALVKGRAATLRGVLCSGGEQWRFAPAPQRR